MDDFSLFVLIVLCITIGTFLGTFLIWYFIPKTMKDKLKRLDDFMNETKQNEVELVKYHNVVIKYGIQINKYLIEVINNNIGKIIDEKVVEDINFKFVEINNNKEKEAQKYLSNMNQRFKKLVEKVEEEENA